MVIVVIKVVVVGVLLLVVLSRLHLATIALLAEGEVEIVALEADPVLGGLAIAAVDCSQGVADYFLKT